MERWGWGSIHKLIGMKYFFILSFTLFFSCNLINNHSINEIDSDELTEFLQINDAILVDVRRDDEYINGHIENSINIDYMSDEFVDKTERLDKNMPIILYCRSGRRSYLSAIKLSEIIEGGNILVSLSERVLGRAPSHDVKHPITGEVIIKKSEMIDEFACEKIDSAGVKFINVYSVITCS